MARYQSKSLNTERATTSPFHTGKNQFYLPFGTPMNGMSPNTSLHGGSGRSCINPSLIPLRLVQRWRVFSKDFRMTTLTSQKSRLKNLSIFAAGRRSRSKINRSSTWAYTPRALSLTISNNQQCSCRL
jgi:hypothetical protein